MLKNLSAEGFLTTLRNNLNDFEYQGLNVLGLINEIYRRGTAAGGDFVSIRSDIVTMIILFLSRGNNVDEMITRTNDAGVLKIRNLKQVYSLMNNVGRGGNTILTLSRVASVFPIVTIGILNIEEVNIPRAVTLPVADFGQHFPKTMQTVIAGAVFPNGDGDNEGSTSVLSRRE